MLQFFTDFRSAPFVQILMQDKSDSHKANFKAASD